MDEQRLKGREGDDRWEQVGTGNNRVVTIIMTMISFTFNFCIF